MKYVVKIVFTQAGIVEYLSDFIEFHSQWQTNVNISNARMYDYKEDALYVAKQLQHIPSFSKYNAELYITEVKPFILWNEGLSEAL